MRLEPVINCHCRLPANQFHQGIHQIIFVFSKNSRMQVCSSNSNLSLVFVTLSLMVTHICECCMHEEYVPISTQLLQLGSSSLFPSTKYSLLFYVLLSSLKLLLQILLSIQSIYENAFTFVISFLISDFDKPEINFSAMVSSFRFL